jgi:hypothetical protein
VKNLLSTPTEGSSGFFSYPAHGNFVPKNGVNEDITSLSPDAKMAIDPKDLSNPLDLGVLARHVR